MKALGEATSDDERAVEAAIRKIDAWRGVSVSYERIPAGITNTNWKIRCGETGSTYFLKIPGARTDLFIDRKAAHDANLKAAQSGYAPRVLFYIDEDDVEVFEFLQQHRSCSNGDFQDPEIRMNVLNAFKALHSGPRFQLTKTYFDMIEEHCRQVEELAAPVPADFDWMMWQYDRARRALEASGLDLVPCMNDTYVTDFMVNDRKEVMFVDFEYAANNDRCSELAIWFFELFFPERVENELIEEYFGEVRPEIKARIAVYKALICIKWQMWSMIQHRISKIDFDYYKYGAWLQLRGRYHMRDWRWEEYLRSL